MDIISKLHPLLIKNYPKNESEWILCYAFFASEYGADTFKKEDIIELYKQNNRYKNNSNNFTTNFNGCIKKDWIKDMKNEEFILKSEGVTYAKEVIKGNSASKEVKRVKKPKTNTEPKEQV